MITNTIGSQQYDPTPKGRPNSLLGLALVLLLTSLLAGCRFGRQAPPTPLPFDFLTPSTPIDREYTVQKGDVVLYERFIGRIALDSEEDIFFGRDGLVANIYVENGARVEAGSLIADLNSQALELDIVGAKLELEQRKNALERAPEILEYELIQARLALRTAEESLEKLLEQIENDPNSVNPLTVLIQENKVRGSQLQLDAIERDVRDRSASLQVSLAEHHLQTLQMSLEQGQIIAPFDGEVRFTRLDRNKRFQRVTAYQTVVQIISSDSLKVEANLVPRQIEKLAEGLQVEMVRQTRPDQVITGEIRDLPQPFGSGVGPLVQISVNDPSQYVGLRAGNAVQVQVEIDRKEGTTWLPLEAVSGFGENYTVLVQDGDSTREVSIEVGMQTDEQVEILGGLAVGDVVERR